MGVESVLALVYWFTLVERFDDGNFKDEMVFGNGYFEEVVEYVRKRRHTEDFE